MSKHESEPSGTTRSTRVRKTGPTKYCGVFVPSKEKPEKAKRTLGDFFCPICESPFTRKEGVNYHFPSCVEKYGNPKGKRWNEHPSCSTKDEDSKGPASKKQKTEMVTSRHSARRAAHPSPLPSARPSAHPPTRASGRPPTRPSTRPHPRRALPQPTITLKRTRDLRSRQVETTAQTQSQSLPAVIPTRPQTTRSKSTLKAQTETQIATSKTATKKASGTARKTRKAGPTSGRAGSRRKYQIDMSLPPLSDLKEIFHDLVSRAWKSILAMEAAMKDLSGKWVHVATMCSGTESPLLAMYKMQDGEYLSRPLVRRPSA